MSLSVLDVVKSANKKVAVKTQRLMNLKRYYLSMYRFYMMKLYDQGYIDDPTIFNQKQIYQNILDLDIKGLQKISGSIPLSSQQIKYALYKNKHEDEQILFFLENLYYAVQYREFSKDIDAVYETFEFNGYVKQKMHLGIKMIDVMVQQAKYAFNISNATVSCLVNFNQDVKEYSVNYGLWELAMQELGIPKELWKSGGILDADLSYDEEVECAEILLEGEVPLNGKYAEKLFSWLKNHKWQEDGMYNSRKGLFRYIFSKYSEKVSSLENSLINSLSASGEQVLAVCKDKVYTAVERYSMHFPIGCFAIQATDEDALIFEGNTLNGYTGECYPVDYLVNEGIMFTGCPIELNLSPKDKELYYDREQVDIQQYTWFKATKSDWVFDSREDIPVKKIKYEENSLEKVLYDLYINHRCGGDIESIEFSFTENNLESAKRNVMKLLNF